MKATMKKKSIAINLNFISIQIFCFLIPKNNKLFPNSMLVYILFILNKIEIKKNKRKYF